MKRRGTKSGSASCAYPLRLERLEPRLLMAAGFTSMGSLGLAGVSSNSLAWGDYDNDGDLDVLLTGRSGTALARVYQNNGGLFSDASVGLTGVSYSSAAWGDYDNDGDLDILLTGLDNADNSVSLVYRNNNGAFSDVSAPLTGVSEGAVAWGDYDNDGDLDILLTGTDGNYGTHAKVYRNSNGTISDISAGLTGVAYSAAAWGDYDNDGDLDILLSGDKNLQYNGVSIVYRNDGGGKFAKVNAGLKGVYDGSVAWGDFDNDGDLDILLTGTTYNAANYSTYTHAFVYRNTNGAFSDISAPLAPVGGGAVAWGDYDNDGDLDILLTGNEYGTGAVAAIYRNTNGSFSNISAGLTGVERSSASWGDYDGDGDLDALVAGQGGNSITRVYRNDSSALDTPPPAPGGLAAAVVGSDAVRLSWTAPADAESPAAALGYNLRVGTTPGGSDVLGPMSFVNPPDAQPDGQRKISQRGLVQGTAWTLRNLAGGTYYWSVQAVDTALEGGPFAAEGSFSLGSVIVDDPVNPGQQVLNISGTDGEDKIGMKLDKNGNLRVDVNGAKGLFVLANFDRISVSALGGDDKVTIGKKLAQEAWVDAGGGDDTVKGGAGRNLLRGGPGDDTLTGGPLGDVLIGGAGLDKASGGKGKVPPGDSDLLIGGMTVYDAVDAALQAILAEWTSGNTYDTRVANLRGGVGVPPLSGAALVADNAADTLAGGIDRDWFLAGAEDTLKDRATDEDFDAAIVHRARAGIPIPDTPATVRRKRS